MFPVKGKSTTDKTVKFRAFSSIYTLVNMLQTASVKGLCLCNMGTFLMSWLSRLAYV